MLTAVTYITGEAERFITKTCHPFPVCLTYAIECEIGIFTTILSKPAI